MPIEQIFDSTLFIWVILPCLIFLSRICDVSIGTIRIIFVSRGKKYLAPLLGFFEVIIWLVAISQIMSHLNNVFCYIAYGAGFAMGNFVGILLEEKLALGTLIVRIILINDDNQLKERLYDAGYGVTSIDAHGMSGDVKIIHTVIKRKDLNTVVEIIESCHSNAFYSVEDAKKVNEGIFPSNKTRIPITTSAPGNEVISNPTAQSAGTKK